MKGLMFNLLENLANEAGCSDEAWELVVEFAATEALLDQAANAPCPPRLSTAPLSYTSPTEAMVRCLSHGDLGERRSWDMLDAAQHQEWFATEWNVSATGRGTANDGERGGFSAEAFLEPDALLNNWGHDGDLPVDASWEEEEQAEQWIREQKAAHKRRS